MPLVNENVANGLPPGATFQSGVSDTDNLGTLGKDVSTPWASEPAGSYVYYDCTIDVVLDSGIVVHNRLPQSDPTPSSLGAYPIDFDGLDQVGDVGVNLKSNEKYTDIMQRMAHARYWFRLSGEALRVGYKIPIPSIKTIGGVLAIPHDNNPQWAFNKIAPGGNYGGVILWWARWSLWYTTLVPPINNTIPVADLAAHISADVPPPKDMQLPYTNADDNAVSTSTRGTKPGNAGPFTR